MQIGGYTGVHEGTRVYMGVHEGYTGGTRGYRRGTHGYHTRGYTVHHEGVEMRETLWARQHPAQILYNTYNF